MIHRLWLVVALYLEHVVYVSTVMTKFCALRATLTRLQRQPDVALVTVVVGFLVCGAADAAIATQMLQL